jgi:hypothetical protein
MSAASRVQALLRSKMGISYASGLRYKSSAASSSGSKSNERHVIEKDHALDPQSESAQNAKR